MFLTLSNTIKVILKVTIFILVLSILLGLAVSIIFPIGYKEYINKYSKEYDIDPFLVAAIIKVESNYNKDAASQKDARGLMQIGPQTGIWASEELSIEGYRPETLFEPKVNIRIGIWYLNILKKEFNNDINLVLAAYNAGSGNVNKWLSDKSYSSDGINLDKIPFEETDEYLDKVKFNYQVYKKLYTHYMEKPDNMNNIYTDVIISLRTYFKNILKSLR